MKSFKKLLFLPVLVLGTISSCYNLSASECPDCLECPEVKEGEKCETCEKCEKCEKCEEIESPTSQIPSDPNQLNANYTNAYIPKNKTKQIIVSDLEDGVTLSYESSNINIANVNSNGLITAGNMEGTCYVTITSSASKKKIVTVNVVDYTRYWMISGDAIIGCLDKEIDEMTLPSGYSYVANYAFEGFTKLKKIIVPEGYVSIGDFSFIGCGSLEEIDLPATLSAFGYQIGIQNSVKTIRIAGSSTISNTSPYFKLLGDGKVLTTKGSHPTTPNKVIFAFGQFDGTFITNDINVDTTVENFAFATLKSLNTFNHTRCIAYGDYAFARSGISEFWYPQATTRIGVGCFLGCSNLKQMKKSTTTGDPYYYLVSNSENGFNTCLYTSKESSPRRCVGSSIISGEKYKTHIRSDATTKYDKLSFCERLQVEKLILNDDVVSLGALSFGYNENLKHVFVPANIEIELFPSNEYIEYLFYDQYPFNLKVSDVLEKCGPFAGCNEDLTVYSLATNEDLTVPTDDRSEEDVQKLIRNFNGLSNFKYKVISQEEYNEIFGD